MEDLAQGIADQVESFLLAVREIARDGDRGTAVPLLLLEVSQLLLAGARLGVHEDFVPTEQFEPDAGPDPDLDEMRRRLADLLEGVDDFTEVFDPYIDPPELVHSRVSDDLADIAASVAHGLQHYRAGSVAGGAVVVAVLLRLELGAGGERGAARHAVGDRPRPARRRRDRRDRGLTARRRRRHLTHPTEGS